MISGPTVGVVDCSVWHCRVAMFYRLYHEVGSMEFGGYPDVMHAYCACGVRAQGLVPLR